MADDGKSPRDSETSTNALDRRRRVAWILILIVDAGLIAWGAMAAAWPDHLLGPGGKPILVAVTAPFLAAPRPLRPAG